MFRAMAAIRNLTRFDPTPLLNFIAALDSKKKNQQDAQRIGESIEAVESRLSTRKTANMNSYKL
jgi:hypothetical protein